MADNPHVHAIVLSDTEGLIRTGTMAPSDFSGTRLRSLEASRLTSSCPGSTASDTGKGFERRRGLASASSTARQPT
jgi:hypothetical protein